MYHVLPDYYVMVFPFKENNPDLFSSLSVHFWHYFYNEVNLQARIASLYDRGRANLTRNELRYFQLPLEQRQQKGIENMMLWVTMVESIFRKRGEARQLKLDTWLTGTTPPYSWREKLKDRQQTSENLVGGLGGSFLDPR